MAKSTSHKTTNSDTIKKKAMIQALEKSLGVVTTACKSVGIARSTHYEWMEKDAEYKAFVDGIQDIALDFAESMLHKQIQNGEVSSTIFYLKTKGKKRGYIERTETDLTTKGESLNVPVDLSKLSKAELIELKKINAKLGH